MIWIGFGVFQRKSHSVGMKEALTWSGVWVALALVFNMDVTFSRERAFCPWRNPVSDGATSC